MSPAPRPSSRRVTSRGVDLARFRAVVALLEDPHRRPPEGHRDERRWFATWRLLRTDSELVRTSGNPYDSRLSSTDAARLTRPAAVLGVGWFIVIQERRAVEATKSRARCAEVALAHAGVTRVVPVVDCLEVP
jgi:hypothetical protein